MDASTADSPRFFQSQKDLIKSIMRSLGNSADNFRASLVLYSFSATVLADLDSYTTPQRFEEVVNRATYLRGMGCFVCKCYNKLIVLNSTANCSISRSAEKEIRIGQCQMSNALQMYAYDTIEPENKPYLFQTYIIAIFPSNHLLYFYIVLIHFHSRHVSFTRRLYLNLIMTR